MSAEQESLDVDEPIAVEAEVVSGPDLLSISAHGHHYPLFLIHLAISQVMFACTSFRGSTKCFELWSKFFPIGTPCLNSVRQWLMRVGLYILQQPQIGQDWIWVIDLSVELGPTKCLVVLGITQAQWQEHLEQGGGGLKHHQMTVLAIEVLSKCNGLIIEQKLLALAERIGAPIQIVGDHGSDLHKGVRLYSESIEGLIETHDVTHAMALLLKHLLEPNESFQDFLRQCNLSRQQLQQTSWSFLRPPAQRSKARYLNLGPLLDWAQGLLDYYQRGDFSNITPEHCCDRMTLFQLVLIPHIEESLFRRLMLIEDETYDNQAQFRERLIEVLGLDAVEKYGQLICQVADLGRRKFEEKVGWLLERASELHQYQQFLALVTEANTQLKHQGLKHLSYKSFRDATQNMELSEQGKLLRTQIIEYIKEQGINLTQEQTVLASSDVIESVFGKYKTLAENSPLKEIGKMILAIPLCTVELTLPFLKQALESVRGVDVDNWAKEVLGPSMLSQRKVVLNPTIKDMKVA